jgi:hypothetical protein
VPMSIRNVDRHGIGNLKQDAAKPLDRIKIPPYIIYLLLFGGIIYLVGAYHENEEL